MFGVKVHELAPWLFGSSDWVSTLRLLKNAALLLGWKKVIVDAVPRSALVQLCYTDKSETVKPNSSIFHQLKFKH